MNNDEYRNKQIETLGPLISTPLTCYAAPEGLPISVLQPSPSFPLMPKVCLRIVASMHGDINRFESFLQNDLGLTKGVDYERHHNGMRHGMGYFDFPNPSIIQRLESYTLEKGLKPKVFAKMSGPPWLSDEKYR